MAILPGLQLNVSQQLKLTPQLQQSIKILQCSAMELQQAIEEALDGNIMLELDQDEDQDTASASNTDASGDAETGEDGSNRQDEGLDLQSMAEQAGDTDQLTETLDCQWDDLFDSDAGSESPSNEFDDFSSVSASSDEDYVPPENYTAAHEDLYDHLRWQVETFPFRSDEDLLIAYYLIDAITPQGYLETPLDEIAQDILAHEDVLPSAAQMERVLKLLQDNFEPSGVAARTVQECLLIQLRGLLPRPPLLQAAISIIEDRFDWFVHGEYVRLRRIFALDDASWQQVLNLIQSCNPKPGLAYANAENEVIVPDLIIRRDGKQGWRVELNAQAYPRVRVNQTYVDLLKQGDRAQRQDARHESMKEKLAEARGLIKSLQSRGETLLRVASFIVEQQAAFFEQGEVAMKPMVLRDLADALGLHESTISRATTQKFMQTPRGTYELKYFFSSSVSQYGPQDQSATAIKARIKQLIDAEDVTKPLSDQDLVEQLEAIKISVARRTVAKYREALNIPSSSQRRKRK